MKVVVFDLDDTLYEELTFVRSGFKSVARLLNEHFQVNARKPSKLCAMFWKKRVEVKSSIECFLIMDWRPVAML